MKIRSIYRILFNYKGTVYTSMKYHKTIEKAEQICAKCEDARAILHLMLVNGEESLVECFELCK